MDYKEELQRFNFYDLDEDFFNLQNETSIVLSTFNSLQKRLNVEQHKLNTQLEDITGLLEEEKEKDQEIRMLREKLSEAESEQFDIIRGVIPILDTIEDMYRFSLKNEDSSLAAQMKLIWNNASGALSRLGLIKIEGENASYDPTVHTVKAIAEREDTPDRVIVEILRCGYIYMNDSIVLRKAEVIVNKHQGGKETDE